MASISLGQNGMVYASRIVGGDGVYMPDATTILNKTGAATSDTWGAAQIAQLTTDDGFVAPPGMDIKIQFVGNTGSGVVQEYDPIADDFVTIKTIDDAEAHVIQAPMGPFRVGVVTDTNCTYVKLKAEGF